MDIKIIDVIKDLCRMHDTSIPKIEKEIGLSNGSIYNWSRSYPSIDKVIKVADYFNVSVDTILGREFVEKEEPVLQMSARKNEGPFTDEEIIILKKLSQVLINSKIDLPKDK